MQLNHRLIPLVIAVCLAVPWGVVQAVDGVHYGDGNLPAGCVSEAPPFTDTCYHMRTDLNSLDTPIIDVLLVTPVSPYAERDLRTMRQSIEMWAAGIEYLAPQLGLDWLEQVEFNIFLDDQTFTTDPAWDPEIVVVAANPVVAGVQGIGIDPIGYEAPCRGANPLAPLEAWEALPGFDSHHGGHSGTYVEECEGGGTTCYAVNLAIDPVPGVVDDVLGMNMFDLVSHEVGHCLSVGHVGDAGDHTANAVPVDDIMSYTHDREPGKCVSSLDVEAFAVRMSRYLLETPLVQNDASNPDGAFVVQQPSDHFYASTTGLAEDCPVPDIGIVSSGERVDFTPAGGIRRSPPTLDVTSHADGDTVAATSILIEGSVKYGQSAEGDQDLDGIPDSADNCVFAFNPNQADGDADGAGDVCDATLGVFPVPDGTIRGGITIFSDLDPVLAHNELVSIATGAAGDAKPRFTPGEPVTFHSRFTTAPSDNVTVGETTFTWHVWAKDGTLVRTMPCTTSPDGSATGADGFDCEGQTTMPTEPGTYYATARLDGSSLWIRDDPAEDPDHPGLKGMVVIGASIPTALDLPLATTVAFEDDGDPKNTFNTEDSTFGVLDPVFDTSERFTLDIEVRSRVSIRLEWSGPQGTNDLDLFVTGAADMDSARRATVREQVVLESVPRGTLDIRVEPFLVSNPVAGTTYTLVATLEPIATPTDNDGDGVPDQADLCPDTPVGETVGEDGCPPTLRVERVVVFLDDVEMSSTIVQGRGGADFALPLDLGGRSGPVGVRVAWFDGDWLVREERLTLVVE